MQCSKMHGFCVSLLVSLSVSRMTEKFQINFNEISTGKNKALTLDPGIFFDFV